MITNLIAGCQKTRGRCTQATHAVNPRKPMSEPRRSTRGARGGNQMSLLAAVDIRNGFFCDAPFAGKIKRIKSH
jgi:hypothetical protein